MKKMFLKLINKISLIISNQITYNQNISGTPPNTIDAESINQQLQLVLVNQYQILRSQNNLPKISDTGFRCYSQFEEDGLLLYVLSVVGFTSKKVVEMCCGSGDECMATNLILNHGFEGFLFDGDEKSVALANSFFKTKKDTHLYIPKIKHAWITRQNVNDLLKDIGASGEVDLFSLDIDGNDYWIWEAISEINPRVCIFETMNVIPGNLSLTMEYQEDFNYAAQPGLQQENRSASLAAMINISKKKGYRLIGAHRHGFNVIFLRNDIGQDIFPEISIEEVHNNSFTKHRQEIWPLIKDMKWVTV